MERIRIEDDKVILKLNRDFYSIQSIHEAISAFSELAEIESKDDTIIIRPKSREDIEIIGYEFSNFVLAGMMD